MSFKRAYLKEPVSKASLEETRQVVLCNEYGNAVTTIPQSDISTISRQSINGGDLVVIETTDDVWMVERHNIPESEWSVSTDALVNWLTGKPFAWLYKEVNGERIKRRIVCAAISVNDLMLVGIHHNDAFMQAQRDAYWRNLSDYAKARDGFYAEGFLDNCGDFWGREKAYTIALNAGQVVHMADDKRLYTKDLY